MTDTDTAKQHLDAGIDAFVSNDIETSVTRFSEALEADPGFAMAYVSRAAANMRLERPEEALSDLNQAIGLTPDHARAYHLRGLAHVKLEDNEKALQDFDNAIQLDPEYGAAYYSRSMIYGDMGMSMASFEDIQMYTHLTEKRLQEFSNENNIWRSEHLRVEEAGAADVMNR
jgi:tetratricopeptide (TPR) repeat protein